MLKRLSYFWGDIMPKAPLEIHEQRGYLVVKSNDLIQKSRYDLSAQESKLILYLISKIQPDDTDFQSYTFDLKDLCSVCGITYNGKNYRDFKEAIQPLSDRSFWIETDSKDMLCRWVSDCVIDKGETTVTVRLDYKLKPYLLQLRENFTSYQLENILVMKSKYASRLYELLLSYAYKGRYKAELPELREILGIAPEQYKVYNNLKVRVLDVAVKEINTFTDLNVSFSLIRAGHRAAAIEFIICHKSTAENIKALFDRQEVLNGENK